MAEESPRLGTGGGGGGQWRLARRRGKRGGVVKHRRQRRVLATADGRFYLLALSSSAISADVATQVVTGVAHSDTVAVHSSEHPAKISQLFDFHSIARQPPRNLHRRQAESGSPSRPATP